MVNWKVNMHYFFLWSISWKSRWSQVIHLNLLRSFFFPPLHASHDLSVVMKLKWGPKAVAHKTRRAYKLGFYGTFKQCKWKTVFALLITKNALFEYSSKVGVVNMCNQEATRHASCLFSLSSQCSWIPVSGEQPNYLCSKSRGYVKEENIFRKTVTDLLSHNTTLPLIRTEVGF